MTPEQRELARHALGLPNKANRSYPSEDMTEPRRTCPTPKPPECVQQPVYLGNAGFIVWRCAHCGSEDWT